MSQFSSLPLNLLSAILDMEVSMVAMFLPTEATVPAAGAGVAATVTAGAATGAVTATTCIVKLVTGTSCILGVRDIGVNMAEAT